MALKTPFAKQPPPQMPDSFSPAPSVAAAPSDAASDVAASATRTCPKCDVDKVFTGQCCIPCNSFKVKSYRRLLKEDDEVLTDNWADLSKQKKQEIYREHHNLVGDHLLAVIKEAVEETNLESLKKKLAMEGAFKDEEDLTKKYKDKGDQLANIFANSITMICPVRQVKLWVDPEFSTATTFTQEQEKKRTLSVQAEHKRKKIKPNAALKDKKANKASEGDGNAEGGGTATKPLTARQRALQKIVQEVSGHVTKIEENILEAEKFSASIPPALITKWKKIKVELDEACSTAQLTVETSENLDPKEFKTMLSTEKKKGSAGLAEMKKRIALAVKESHM